MTDQYFNWTGLPTELKERVVECCTHQALEQGVYRQRLSRWFDRRRPRDGCRESGIYEIVDKLTDWAALLGVSHQVRTITLRLCFTYHGGFTILATSGRSFAGTLERLDRYYQMMDDNGLPVDDGTKALAEDYRKHPRIHPQLERYSTFRHAIRNIHLKMGFIACMHFFKVKVGEFRHHLRPGSISYDVFEGLPNLRNITVQLPRKPYRGWRDTPAQPSPPLFFPDSPCPRTLHRLIYGCIATTLTLYPQVQVYGFIDADERILYESLREAAIHDRAWSSAELAELYAECGGGVELEGPVQPGSYSIEDKKRSQSESIADRVLDVELEDTFFPPKCYCAAQCYLVFHEKETRRRNY